jgi:uncharacterized protein
MIETIRRRLDALENEHGVRLLFAIESGSRAWGFPSPDSDWDVRFVYARRRDDYLKLELPRDVIELPVEGALDINGWDLRKALQLARRSNPVLLEWLTSPICYGENAFARARLLDVARLAARTDVIAFHYDRTARRSFENLAERRSAKRYCYSLRPSLALAFLRSRNQPPPMDVPMLLAGLDLPRGFRDAVAVLIEAKSQLAEQDTTSKLPVIDAFIETVLSVPAPPPTSRPSAAVIAATDNLFRELIQ